MCKNLSNYQSHYNASKRIGLPEDSTQLDWIMKQARCVILFYDKDQIVFPAGINLETALSNSFDTRMRNYYTLLNQMRCMGGKQYLADIKGLIHGSINHKVSSDNYEIYLANDFYTFDALYRKKEKKHGLTRMVAGYAWPWKSKTDKCATDIEIEGYKKKWNSVLENWVHSSDAENEIGCIHSTQGYDLNYGFVILGEDIKYDPTKQKVYVDRNNYYDRYGQQGASDTELDEYIKNIYYVLMSRGVRGTYLYVCNKELKEYFSRYMNVILASDVDSLE